MNKKLFLFLFFFLLLAGGVRFAAAEVEVPLPTCQTLPCYAGYFFWLAMILGGVAAAVVLVLSGIQFIYSAGSPEKRSDAKKKIISAVLGLALLLSSFILIRTINPKLENLDPTEDLKMISPFLFFGGRDGASIGNKSGCEINQCLGFDGTCSWENCHAYDYGDCQAGSGCPDPNSEGACSWDNCVNGASGCGLNQCLGLDGTCSWVNCNWGIAKPAPMSLENTDAIREKYSKIIWMETIMGLSENLMSSCDPENPNAIYVLYLYSDYNYKNLYALSRMRCDENWIDISAAKSYMLIKETPGVYFYGNENCYPSGDTPPAAFTESIPKGWSEEVRSVRVVNGPDLRSGPFFGLIYFNGSDYKTNQANPLFKHWPVNIYSQINAYDNYSRCYPVGVVENFRAINGSWVVYRWTGWDEVGRTFSKAGDGVTLYSKTDWLGGYYQAENQSRRRNWIRELNLQTTPVFYSLNSKVPAEEQELCPYFYPESSCLKSFEIKGDYLVILSSVPDIARFSRPWVYEVPRNAINGHAQAFPISPGLQETYKNREGYSVEKGTPELPLDYIGWMKAANFMEIIPLAGKSN